MTQRTKNFEFDSTRSWRDDLFVVPNFGTGQRPSLQKAHEARLANDFEQFLRRRVFVFSAAIELQIVEAPIVTGLGQ